MFLGQYLKTHKKTYLIFDLDETLLELILPWDLWEKNIEGELEKIDQDILKNYKNRKIGLNEMQNAYVSKNPEVKELLDKNAENFEVGKFKGIRVNHGLVDFVKNTKGYQMFIWTSNTRKTAENTLNRTGILNKFAKIVSCEDTKFLKPRTDGFDKIYDTKISKLKYVLIGDSSSDRQASRAAQIDFYKVSF